MNTAEMAKLTSVPVSKSETVPDNQRADRTEARKVLEGSSQQVKFLNF